MTEQEISVLEAMLERIERCEESNDLLMKSNTELIRSNRALSEALETLREEYERFVDNNVYEIMDPRVQGTRLFYPRILPVDETLETIITSSRSICRFGDGEFACISGKLRANFTSRYYERLSIRLREVLLSDRDDVMIALADNYGDLSRYIPSSRREIRSYMTREIRNDHEALLNEKRQYYNAYVTRPFMFLYDDKDALIAYFERFKRLWDNRDVVMIEGCNTGFGVGNDLLEGCNSIRRIIIPAKDAFEKYEEIYETAITLDESCLYLIAAGPVATVLAYDLAVSGRQAVDIGHLDIEYEWMKKGEYRTPIPNKYVNEVFGGIAPEPIVDDTYERQILKRIA